MPPTCRPMPRCLHVTLHSPGSPAVRRSREEPSVRQIAPPGFLGTTYAFRVAHVFFRRLVLTPLLPQPMLILLFASAHFRFALRFVQRTYAEFARRCCRAERRQRPLRHARAVFTPFSRRRLRRRSANSLVPRRTTGFHAIAFTPGSRGRHRHYASQPQRHAQNRRARHVTSISSPRQTNPISTETRITRTI